MPGLIKNRHVALHTITDSARAAKALRIVLASASFNFQPPPPSTAASPLRRRPDARATRPPAANAPSAEMAPSPKASRKGKRSSPPLRETGVSPAALLRADPPGRGDLLGRRRDPGGFCGAISTPWTSRSREDRGLSGGDRGGERPPLAPPAIPGEREDCGRAGTDTMRGDPG
jgi:hypothetical protein